MQAKKRKHDYADSKINKILRILIMNIKELFIYELKLSLRAIACCIIARIVNIGYSAYRGVISFQTFKEIWMKELPLYLAIYIVISVACFVYRVIKLKLLKNKEIGSNQ